MIRLTVISPEVAAVYEVPPVDVEWPACPAVSIDMLRGAWLYVGGAQRYEEGLYRVPVMVPD